MSLSSEERERIRVEERYRSELRRQEERRRLGMGCAGVIFLIVIIGSCVALLGDSNPDTPTPSSPGIGDEGIIAVEGLSQVTVAVDKDAFNALTKAVVAKDDIGYAAVLVSGRAFMVPTGVSVRVIDRDFASTQVRILTGEYAGRSGWLPYEWVVRGGQ